MRIAVIGAGAMGSIFGGRLAQAGEDVTLIDVWREGVEAINRNGLCLEDKAGNQQNIRVPATTDPAAVGVVDLAIVFVKCYHTKEAVQAAMPIIGPNTSVLTLQNGWGNAPRIAEIVGQERVIVGLTYNSGTVLGPGHVAQPGQGMTFVGELDGSLSERARAVTEAIQKAGFEATLSSNIIKDIWSKLAHNACTLPTSALLRVFAGQLVEHESTLEMMRGILREVVAVANIQGVDLSYNERWEAITGLLKGSRARASMLQDVEKKRRTEIDVINGAIVEAGRRFHLPTPYNDSMVWLIRSLEESFTAN
jgi:2-dehydropantoate 2-reductase